MMRLLRTVARALHGARCPSGCYCVKDRFAWRCTVCGHIC